jgi:hypothetical protein
MLPQADPSPRSGSRSTPTVGRPDADLRDARCMWVAAHATNAVVLLRHKEVAGGRGPALYLDGHRNVVAGSRHMLRVTSRYEPIGNDLRAHKDQSSDQRHGALASRRAPGIGSCISD